MLALATRRDYRIQFPVSKFISGFNGVRAFMNRASYPESTSSFRRLTGGAFPAEYLQRDSQLALIYPRIYRLKGDS